MLRKISLLVVFAMLSMALTTATAQDDRIQLNFWHAMGGNLGEATQALVDAFNASQDEIFVTATFQGSYDDTYNALLAALETGTLPNVVQNFDLASQTMFDFPGLLPAHALFEADGFDPDVFVPAVRDYYSNADGMVAMAFNSSTPILFYNAEILAEAGVELANDASLSFSEFMEVCDTIRANTDTQYCVSFGQVGWFFEQILANSGGLYFNNDNGRTGRASEAVFNGETGVEVFTFLTNLLAEGYAPYLGNTWTDSRVVFTSGEAALHFDSTAAARGLEDTSDFEVVTTYIPYADSAGDRNGVIIGGAALWLLDAGDDVLNQAAWTFMKFMAEDAQQVPWHMSTGYFPVRVALNDNPTLIEFWDENPNFATAVRQLGTTRTALEDGTPNYPVLGGQAGPFPAIRSLIVTAYSRVMNDGLTAQEALDEAATAANRELADYNSFFE